MAINRSGNNNMVYGVNNPLAQLPNSNIRSQRRPTPSDSAEIGTLWLYYVPGQLPELYMYTSPGVWTQISLDGGSSEFDSLTVNGPSELNGDLTITTQNVVIDGQDYVDSTVNISGIEALNITSTRISQTIGSEGFNLESEGPVNILSSGSSISITSYDALSMTSNAQTSSIEAGQDIFIGSTGSGTVHLGYNLTNFQITGNIALYALHGEESDFTYTSDTFVGSFTIINQTINSGASQVITLNNSKIYAGDSGFYSGILVNVSNTNVSGNGAYLQVTGVVLANGSAAIHITNNSGFNLAATDRIIVSFIVLN